jgi:hypothetical protein
MPPPIDSLRSKITTFLFASAKYLPATRPAGPAPAIATSTSKQSLNSSEKRLNIIFVTLTSSIPITTPL